jgi:bifunctional N-acetylglucosamine-1-phosphate-uridyltransferase/glucosamine-1-phosphate-acetyltransferase GlmU-like protein
VRVDGVVVRRADAEIGAGARVGPFAVLNPGARVAPGTVTGAFYRGDSEE